MSLKAHWANFYAYILPIVHELIYVYDIYIYIHTHGYYWQISPTLLALSMQAVAFAVYFHVVLA